MPLTDLNRKIYYLLKDLEDLDDEILFGSNRKPLPELLIEEKALISDLEQLYLVQLDILERGLEALNHSPDSPQSYNINIC